MDLPSLPIPLEDLIRRLFDGQGDNELPAYEKKNYFLTHDELERYHEKLIETMAAIANRGQDVGLILCSRDGDPGQLVDAEQIDAKMRSVAGPAVRFTVSRLEVGGRVVDLIVIPKSSLRPHLVRDRRTNRYYFPIRGAANNATAARHELDEMIEERVIEQLRRAFPSIQADARDPVERYAQEIGYGLEGNDPQIAILVIPMTSRERVAFDFNHDRQLDRLLFDITNKTVNAGFDHYYTVNGVLFTRYGEDFAQFLESAVNGNQTAPLWSNRIYTSGAVTRQSILWPATLHGSWTIDWLVNEVLATLRYADIAYELLNVADVGQLRVLTVLRNAAQFPIRDISFIQPKLLHATQFDDPLIIPTRFTLKIDRSELAGPAAVKLASEVGRVAKTFYS